MKKTILFVLVLAFVTAIAFISMKSGAKSVSAAGTDIEETEIAQADSRLQPVDQSKAPPEAGGQAAPAQTPAQPGAQTTSGGYSDLPEGWEEPTQLPPGSIKLEEVQGRPVGTPQAEPGAAPAPARGEEVEEVEEVGEKKPPPLPPSRWGN